MTSRRRFLSSLCAAGLMPQLSWADAGQPQYLAAAQDKDGGFALYGLTAAGQPTFRVPLPMRGHAAAAHPTRPEAVAFARRPGTFALVVNCATGAVDARLSAPKGRHFMGHGVFVAEGDILVTTENDYENGRGALGVWQRSLGYKRIGEVASHGIGPHDIRALSDGRLVIANGGILTHPDVGEGREKLNLDTMQASLTYLKPDLSFEAQHVLPTELHQNSIRHLAVTAQDQVAFAMQWQGDPFDEVPLVGLHHGQGALQLCEAPMQERMAMKAYASSISLNGDETEIGITSSKTGRLQRFDLTGQFIAGHARPDLSGLAPLGQGYLGSDGFGNLLTLGEKQARLGHISGLAWDNHLVSLA